MEIKLWARSVLKLRPPSHERDFWLKKRDAEMKSENRRLVALEYARIWSARPCHFPGRTADRFLTFIFVCERSRTPSSSQFILLNRLD